MNGDNQLRVLQVGPVPPPLGGIVRYCQDIMTSDLARKYCMSLFPDNIPPEYRPHVTTAKNTWNIIRRDGFISTGRVFNFVLKKMILLNKILSTENYDVMHVHSSAGYGFFRNAMHLMIASSHNVKTIFHLHGQIDDLYRQSNPLLKRLIAFCLNRSDINVALSPKLAELYSQVTSSPVHAISNGVRTEELVAPDGYAHSSGDNFIVITLGYLGFQKGTFDIIEAAKRLRNKLPQMQFLFVGGGEIDKFKNLVAENSLSDVINFAGVVSDETRTNLLQTSDIFLLPSHAEGQPIAILEAMATGLPIISSRVGAIPEVIKEGVNGFLINPGEIKALVRHLGVLGSNASRRKEMGTLNAKEAHEKYSIRQVMGNIEKIYGHLREEIKEGKRIKGNFNS